MIKLELSPMQVTQLKDCLLCYEEKLLADIKRKSEILQFQSVYITDEFLELTNLSLDECYASLDFCKSLFRGLTH